MIKKFAILLLCVLQLTGCQMKTSEPVELVNVLQGTNSIGSFSTGNTYPAVAIPWGMNFWTPQTRQNGNGWHYVYTDLEIRGFKQTHQPSPWINDYGCFSVFPQEGVPVVDENKRAVSYRRENEIAKPYYYAVTLDNGIQTEMTATNSGAAFRFHYSGQKESVLVLDCFPQEGKITIDTKNNRIVGHTSFMSKNNNAHAAKGFASHFILEFDRPIQDFAIYGNGQKASSTSLSGEALTAYVSFGEQKLVEMKVASSFISEEQAMTNFDTEVRKNSFDAIKKQARNTWNQELSRISVKGGTEDEQRTFYTAMYRTLLFPRKTHEQNNGKQIHYSFYDGNVHEGPMFSDNGFWDTFRAVHPLFTILYPTLSEELMTALLNIYHEGGWMPEWFSPGYKDCMIGQHSSSVITDAYLKGIGNYDPEEMWEALVKCAENEGPNATGRRGIEAYRKYGYIPCDLGIRQNASMTMEYAYNDWCISRFAEKMGKDPQTVEYYRNRADSYKNLIDTETGFVRPKDQNGKWITDFDPADWSRAFTEGSPWHWTWSVFHDPAGLIQLLGGEERFIERLDEVFTAEPRVGLGGRTNMIHEMKEMIAGNMGQYAHGNQPIQHMPYLYNYAGAPYKTQQRIHEITDKLYHSGIEDGKGLCGDEDNGQTSAWYIFSALGFYPLCPGTGEYIIGSPMFEEATIELQNGKKFTVRAQNYSTENIYIQSAFLNGVEFEESYLTHDQIMNGGSLEFIMGPEPNKEWAKRSRPYSMSTEK